MTTLYFSIIAVGGFMIYMSPASERRKLWIILVSVLLFLFALDRACEFIDCFFHYTRNPNLLHDPQSSVGGWCSTHVLLWPIFL